MPPRLNKRQLREQEELQALQDVAAEDRDDHSEASSPVVTSKIPVGGFAAVSSCYAHPYACLTLAKLLGSQEEEEESEEEETQARSSKSKKAREPRPLRAFTNQMYAYSSLLSTEEKEKETLGNHARCTFASPRPRGGAWPNINPIYPHWAVEKGA